MENSDKIYPSELSLSVDWQSFGNSVKGLFFMLLPLAKTLLLFGASVFIFVVLQILVIGVFDRLGISPKIGFLVSSLFYITAFSGLAIVGGLKRKLSAADAGADFHVRPVCKMLIIKRKNQEMNI